MLKKATRIACVVLTKVLGKEEPLDYCKVGQLVINIINFAMGTNTGPYEFHCLDRLSTWIGHEDPVKASMVADLINEKTCANVTTEEILKCQSVDDVSRLMFLKCGRFFPDFCPFCVDKW